MPRIEGAASLLIVECGFVLSIRWFAISSFTLAAACGSAPPLAAPAAPLTPPEVLCTEAAQTRPCNRAQDVEAWLRDARLEILGSAPAGGKQDAKILTLALPERAGRRVFRARWRALDSESLINDPRKELGAYAVAKLFLEPHEYVVPPTSGHCFPLEHYRARVDATAPPSFEKEGVHCVFGILSYWLENVADPHGAREDGVWRKDGILDEQLFQNDATYRESVADLNLLTYLIHHADSHDKQFLITKDNPSPRVYSVDNSVTFESVKNPMTLFREDWSVIRVPTLSQRSLDILISRTDDDWTRLTAIESYRKQDGQLVPVPPDPPIGPPDAGIRWVGLGVQIGLTETEVAGVRQRLSDLVKRIRRGELRTL